MSREQQDGPIDSLGEVFGTAYGLTWLIGLLAAVATFLRVVGFLVVLTCMILMRFGQ
jgi:hypothetical protein